MSRRVIVIVLLVVCRSVFPAAQSAGRASVRGLDPWANESIERGYRGAAVIRELIRELGTSDLIVHVMTATTLPADLAGSTRFACARGQQRYARITLDRDLTSDTRAATLAHELQHAVEVARSGVCSLAAVHLLYERIGHRVGGAGTYYDTVAAQHAGARAWAELRGPKRRAVRRGASHGRIGSAHGPSVFVEGGRGREPVTAEDSCRVLADANKGWCNAFASVSICAAIHHTDCPVR